MIKSRTRSWPRLRTAARSGFTLIELLIGVLLTAIVIGGTYLMFTSSSEVFNHQNLTSENHNNIRFAVELLKADIGRAGFLSSPNGKKDLMACPPPAFEVPAISLQENVAVKLETTGPDFLTADRLLVVGDMSAYPPFQISSISGTTVMVVPNPDVDDVTFASIFDEPVATYPRVIRLVNPDGLFQFGEVDTVTNDNQLTLVNALTAADTASCGYSPMAAENHEINAVTGYIYEIQADPLTDKSMEKTDLVRWRADFTAGGWTNIPGTRLVVAEYVVGLDFVALGIPSGQPFNDPGVPLPSASEEHAMSMTATTDSVMTAAEANADPQRIRYIDFRVKTRTRKAIPRRLSVPSGTTGYGHTEQVYFELSDDRVADVRTIQGKVAVPNLTLRNLR